MVGSTSIAASVSSPLSMDPLANPTLCQFRCIGGKADHFSSPEEFERVSYTFTLNAAHFLSKLAQSQTTQGQTDRAGQPFRFCYCSAKWANRDGKAGSGLFSFESQTRNMKVRTRLRTLVRTSSSLALVPIYLVIASSSRDASRWHYRQRRRSQTGVWLFIYFVLALLFRVRRLSVGWLLRSRPLDFASCPLLSPMWNEWPRSWWMHRLVSGSSGSVRGQRERRTHGKVTKLFLGPWGWVYDLQKPDLYRAYLALFVYPN